MLKKTLLSSVLAVSMLAGLAPAFAVTAPLPSVTAAQPGMTTAERNQLAAEAGLLPPTGREAHPEPARGAEVSS